VYYLFGISVYRLEKMKANQPVTQRKLGRLTQGLFLLEGVFVSVSLSDSAFIIE